MFQDPLPRGCRPGGTQPNNNTHFFFLFFFARRAARLPLSGLEEAPDSSHCSTWLCCPVTRKWDRVNGLSSPDVEWVFFCAFVVQTQVCLEFFSTQFANPFYGMLKNPSMSTWFSFFSFLFFSPYLYTLSR